MRASFSRPSFSLAVPAVLVLALGAGPAAAFTWHILPDGSGDAPTIAEGIAAASYGDDVIVHCGTYHEHAIALKSGVNVRSQDLDPACVTIDGDGVDRVFWAQSVLDATLAGFTITNGYRNWGAGISLNASPMVIENCVFVDNIATWQGGGLLIEYCDPYLRNVTIVGNDGPQGGGIYVFHGTPEFKRSIIAFNDGASVFCSTFGDAVFTCSDIHGNTAGDWVDCIADQAEIDGNFSADPLFCWAAGGDCHLSSESPCLDAPGCGQVGAFGQGCGRVWHVPAEVATIAGAVAAAAAGDVVEIACGTYLEHAITLRHGVSIRSETGEADCVTIDGGGADRIFWGQTVSDLSLRGLTITNGHRNWGAGISLNLAPITIEKCVFTGNTATMQGGGLIFESCNPFLRNVTVTANSAPQGGGIYSIGSVPVFENSIVAFNDGVSVFCPSPTWPQFTCSDVYGNTGGDWVGGLAGQLGQDGNFAADPEFCTSLDEWTLDAVSPCLPDSNECGVLIGALGQGCAVVAVPDDGTPGTRVPRISLATAAPNPFNPATRLSFALPRTLPVVLAVHDAAGRRVRTLIAGQTYPAGRHEVVWDGRDDGGRAAGTGVYLFRLDAGGETVVRKGALLK